MAGETKSGWYSVNLKDNSAELSGKTILQVNGEALSRGLHQAVLQYSRGYKSSSNDESRDLFVIITNRRKSENYIIVTTPDDKTYRFPVHKGGLIFDKQGLPGDDAISPKEKTSSEEKNSSVTKLVELMTAYDELKISQGSFYFTIKTTGFGNEQPAIK